MSDELIQQRRWMIIDVSLFGAGAFSAAVAVIALVFLAFMGLVFFLSFYSRSGWG